MREKCEPLESFARLRRKFPGSFGNRTDDSLAKGFISAFHDNLVDIEVISLPNATRDPVKQRQLLNTYQHLREALVVERNFDDSSDEVHRKLGLALARFFSGGDRETGAAAPLLRPRERIGLGGGRGVY
jgi:DNA-binding transcriptional regulator LsrR (DeoR family)